MRLLQSPTQALPLIGHPQLFWVACSTAVGWAFIPYGNVFPVLSFLYWRWQKHPDSVTSPQKRKTITALVFLLLLYCTFFVFFKQLLPLYLLLSPPQGFMELWSFCYCSNTPALSTPVPSPLHQGLMQKLARSLGRTEMVYRKNGLIGTLAVKRRIARKWISQVSPQDCLEFGAVQARGKY